MRKKLAEKLLEKNPELTEEQLANIVEKIYNICDRFIENKMDPQNIKEYKDYFKS